MGIEQALGNNAAVGHTESYALEMRNITKIFPGVIANNKINLGVKKGSIHALVGENGAGKTTLMNILYGLYRPDEGDILINGKVIDIKVK